MIPVLCSVIVLDPYYQRMDSLSHTQPARGQQRDWVWDGFMGSARLQSLRKTDGRVNCKSASQCEPNVWIPTECGIPAPNPVECPLDGMETRVISKLGLARVTAYLANPIASHSKESTLPRFPPLPFAILDGVWLTHVWRGAHTDSVSLFIEIAREGIRLDYLAVLEHRDGSDGVGCGRLKSMVVISVGEDGIPLLYTSRPRPGHSMAWPEQRGHEVLHEWQEVSGLHALRHFRALSVGFLRIFDGGLH
ncbi:hypothetical protein F5141DRAFT_1066007 [Pisolithus sp. B1]|nr:hypothetical protein F5141DRAFT_1066007 [Pisolithus sp. B1]